MQKLYNEQSVQDIANAIREKTGTENSYKISEMAQAIKNISAGDKTFTLNEPLTRANLLENITKIDVHYPSALKTVTIQNLTYVEEINLTCDTKITNFSVNGCTKLKKITGLDLSNVNSLVSAFNQTDLSDFSFVNTIGNELNNAFMAFANCKSMIDLPSFYGGKLLGIFNMFQNSTSLTNFDGIIDLGAAYLTTASANYANYTLNLSSCNLLTHESLINIMNNLFNIKTKGCKTQSLILGTTNLAKLTDSEKAIATNKGWVLS